MPRKDGKAIREHRSIEFRIRAVQMTECAESVSSVARELNIPLQSLHNWIKAYRKGKLGEKISLLPDHIAYVSLLCKRRARDLKSQQAGKNTRSTSIQKEMQTLQELLEKLNSVSGFSSR